MQRISQARDVTRFPFRTQLCVVLASLLILAAGPIAVAGDPNTGTVVARPVVRPAPSASAARGNVGQVRSTVRPNANVVRPVPRFRQPIQRSSVALNAGTTFRDRPRQTVAFSERREVTRTPARSLERPVKNRLGYFDALRRRVRERHDCNWWRRHFTTIVFVSTGYYYLDAGYWYPALGYDPLSDSYDYDGPIYTYGDLLPDQVVANVQSALQEEGYYSGEITGSLGPGTRAALAGYQRDHGLVVTGAIDEVTIESLGLD
jgi:Putative peptidoglycan binding domain